MTPVTRTLFLCVIFCVGFRMGLLSQNIAWSLCLLSILAMEDK